MPGALLVAVGMFLLVFGLNEVGRYGWWKPLERLQHRAARRCGRQSLGVSVLPLVIFLLLGRVPLRVLQATSACEGAHDRDPLFEFGQLRHKGFRYGLITAGILSMGQLGLFFVIPVFLQDAEHLTRSRQRALDAAGRRLPRSSVRSSAAG